MTVDAADVVYRKRWVIPTIPAELMSYDRFIPDERYVSQANQFHPLAPCASCHKPLALHAERNVDNGVVRRARLTDKQLEVLNCLVEGMSIDQVAKKLYLSNSTVKTHISAIYEKLGAHNRAQLVLEAQRHGFIE